MIFTFLSDFSQQDFAEHRPHSEVHSESKAWSGKSLSRQP